MENNKIKNAKDIELKESALRYMKAVADTSREPVLILDADLRVISASKIFCQTFQVSPVETEGRVLYELGNGQWNIPALKKLLEDILPNKKFVKDYEVTHIFEKIGERTMQLNAYQIDSLQLIIICIEDVTTKKLLDKKLADYTKELEAAVFERTNKLADKLKELETMNKTMIGREVKMSELKEEIDKLKQKSQDGRVTDNHS